MKWDGSNNDYKFLSTPSARRATRARGVLRLNAGISIHALREEGDYLRRTMTLASILFLSTPSARRATRGRPGAYRTIRISIHALREEGDTATLAANPYVLAFLSTPSARRATAKTETKSLFSYKLYNILHEFRRALIYNGSKNYPNHAK